jgi:hypothetical protein
MSQNMYFLSKKQTNGGYDANMLAVGKVQNLGQTGGGTANSVVFAFVNNNHLANSNVAATFDLNAKVPGSDLNYFGIERGRNYNVKDLLADNATAYVWATNRTGADLIDNGLFVGIPNTQPGTGSHHAQYLQLVDVSPAALSFAPSQFMTFRTTNTLAATPTPPSSVTYTLIGGDTNKVTLTNNQLVINSGTGSVTVRAAVAATTDRAGATNQATITFQKATQTITFGLDSASATIGDDPRTLTATSDSGLDISYSSSDISVASFVRNTLYINGPGFVTLTASQSGNDNYEAALSVQQTLTVTGSSFASSPWGSQDANSDANGDGVAAILEYAFGGVAGSNNLGVLPQMTRTNTTLSLSVLVRTDDPKLSVFPQAANSLGTNAWSSSGFTTNISTNAVPAGFERRTYTFDAGTNPRAFLRLFITNSP